MADQIVDVRSLVCVLSVLLTTGPIFAADIAFSDFLPSFKYTKEGSENTSYYYIEPVFDVYTSGCLTPLIITVLIPLYLYLLRPFIHDYVSEPLKSRSRNGLISGFCVLLMGLFGPKYCNNSSFILDNWACSNSISSYFTLSSHFVLIPHSLNAIGYMLLYIGLFEFICSQSPSSMKGFLMGTFFAIRGVFQSLDVLLLYLPMINFCHSSQQKFPYCGFIYYFLNTDWNSCIHICIARRYNHRQRPTHIN